MDTANTLLCLLPTGGGGDPSVLLPHLPPQESNQL